MEDYDRLKEMVEAIKTDDIARAEEENKESEEIKKERQKFKEELRKLQVEASGHTGCVRLNRTFSVDINLSGSNKEEFLCLVKKGLDALSSQETATETEQKAVTIGRSILRGI